jgi:hypothetical protein
MSDFSDRDLAVKTLREICSDIDAPKQAKATAARTLLELSGDIGKLQSEKNIRENKALHEMTKAELDAEIMKVSRPSALDSRGAKNVRKHKARLASRPKASREARETRAKYDF